MAITSCSVGEFLLELHTCDHGDLYLLNLLKIPYFDHVNEAGRTQVQQSNNIKFYMVRILEIICVFNQLAGFFWHFKAPQKALKSTLYVMH